MGPFLRLKGLKGLISELDRYHWSTAGFAALVLFFILVGPSRWITGQLTDVDRHNLLNETRRTLIQIAAGLVAVLGAGIAWSLRTRSISYQRETIDNQRDRIDKDWDRAIAESIMKNSQALCRSKESALRVAAIHGLQRDAEYSTKDADREAVIQVIAAHIRDRSRDWESQWNVWEQLSKQGSEQQAVILAEQQPAIPADLGVAFGVLATLTWKRNSAAPLVPLESVWLPNLNLPENTRVGRFDLSKATLSYIRAKGVHFNDVLADGARFDNGKLEEADFQGGSWKGAVFTNTSMPEAMRQWLEANGAIVDRNQATLCSSAEAKSDSAESPRDEGPSKTPRDRRPVERKPAAVQV